MNIFSRSGSDEKSSEYTWTTAASSTRSSRYFRVSAGAGGGWAGWAGGAGAGSEAGREHAKRARASAIMRLSFVVDIVFMSEPHAESFISAGPGSGKSLR